MTQYVINIGAVPNDGTGDPLRTAFNEVNLNFNQVWATGIVGSNITIANNAILTTNTNGNLVLNPNGVGVVQANAHVIPDQNRIRSLGSGAKNWDTVYAWYGQFGGDVSIGGNLTVEGDVVELGNITTDAKTIHLSNSSSTSSAANLSGIVVGANSNIASFLYNATTNSWTTNLAITYPNGAPIGDSANIGLTPPPYGNGNLWYNSDDGRGYIKYNNQWIEFSPTVIPNPSVYLGNLTINGANNSTLYFPPGGNIVFGDNTVQNTAFTGTNVDFTNVASDIIPAANITYSLGNSTRWWTNAWFDSNTVYIGGVGLGMDGNVLTVDGANVVTTEPSGNLVVDNLTANGITSLVGNTVAGNINASGLTSLAGNTTAGNLTANGITSLVGNTVAGNLTATGITSLVGNLVAGNITTTGTRINNGDYIANGTATFNGETLFNGNVTANGVFTVNGPTNLGNASLGNLNFNNQVISGTNINGNISIAPEGSGTVVVPGIALPTGSIVDGSGLTVASRAGNNLVLTGGSGTINTTGNLVPSVHDTYTLGTDGFHWNTLYAGTGGVDILDPFTGNNIVFTANQGNLIVGNAGGMTVAGFTFFNNAITIANTTADFTIGQLSATGNVVFNRAIQVISPITTTESFGVNSEGLTTVYTPGLLDPTKAALNIIGSSSGNVQPRNFSSTLLQLTSQDNASARVSIDSFGSSGNAGGQNSLSSITARVARGSVDAPEQNLANDVMFRLAGQAWNDVGSYQGNIIRLNMSVAENVTSTSAATYFNFQTVAVGSTTLQNVVNIDSDGITLLNSSNITFTNGSIQSTAFNPANVVTKITVGTGLSQDVTQGNVAINATGVQNVAGTTNQVIVSDAGGKNLTLSLPQSINTNSSVQFANITVGNIVVTGNTTSANTLSINDKNLTLANNSSSASQIDGGGIILGNVGNGAYTRTFTYSLTDDAWNTDGAGLITLDLISQNANVANITANGLGRFGAAFTGLDYANATIQSDSNVNSFSQIINVNHSAGTDASADIVATNNIGNDESNYIDLGINSNTYSNVQYTIVGPNDGYLYINGGNLAIGTQTAGNIINFFTGNTLSTNLRANITDNGLNVVGNITGGNISAVGNVNATNLILTGNINAPFTSAVLTTGNQPNITTVGILTSVSVTGNVNAGNLRTAGAVTATGNVTGGNVVATSAVNAATVSTTGNIAAGNNITAGGAISAVGNITGTNLNATLGAFSQAVSATGNVTGNNIISNNAISATGNISGGNLTTGGAMSATGNVDAGNLRTGGIVVATGNIQTTSQLVSTIATGTAPFVISSTTKVAGLNVEQVDGFDAAQANTASTIVVRDSASNIAVANVNGTGVSVSGNVTGAFFVGNGSALTGVTATNATTAVTVTGNAQANITSVGTLTGLSVSGNTTSGNILTGGLVSATGNITGGNLSGTNITGTLSTASQTNITAVGTLTSLNSGAISSSGNVTGANILTGGIVSATGNITGGNLSGTNITGTLSTASQTNITAVGTLTSLNSGAISSSGNVTGANILTAGLISSTGNATAGNVLTGGQVSATGNINGGNLISAALVQGVTVSATGNVIGGNISTAGQVSATGNITANASSFFIGNGSLLTNIATPTVQTFDSGTGATWTKPASANWVLIETWGGGGSGGNGAFNAPGGGGGGGAYNQIQVKFSDLVGAVTYTVGAGGAAQGTGSTAGNPGGQTSVSMASFAGDGTKVLNAFGGGSGAVNAAGGGGGGGGGINSIGANATTTAGGTGGSLVGGAGGAAGSPGVDSTYGGGGGSGNGNQPAGSSYYGGGGGGGAFDGAGTGANDGGNSTYGGGGGGGGVDSATPGAGGTSTYGGNGSAGTTGGAASAAGTLPAGGSGGTEGGGSGAGGSGRVRFTYW